MDETIEMTNNWRPLHDDNDEFDNLLDRTPPAIGPKASEQSPTAQPDGATAPKNPKDRTAAERQRRYRVLKKAERTGNGAGVT